MYEDLVDEIHKNGVEVVEVNFKGVFKGLYADNAIAISSSIDTDAEKRCILAEEIGHHYTSYGDILNSEDIENIKQEKRAKNWGYEKLVGVMDIVNAHKNRARSRHELAEYLNITENFLEESIQHYREKYGLYYQIDHYIVYFDPLGVLEMF